MSLQLDASRILPRLQEINILLRTQIHHYVSNFAVEELSAADRYEGGDTIYTLDTKGEDVLFPYCEKWGQETPFLLVCEGLPGGRQLFGTNDIASAQFVLLCDPIDGTRPLMYDKRSAWLLLGVAPNLGQDTNLSHIEIALQGELPTSKAAWADTFWAVAGQGAHGESTHLDSGANRPARVRPSQSATIEGGYAMFAKFFPGSKGWLANLEEKLVSEVLGEPADGQPLTFDDQYISNGGMLYEIMTGRDRFSADLRPIAHHHLHGGASNRLCSHPYDMAAELILREAGGFVTDEHGDQLKCPLDVESPVTWIAYANEQIRRQVEPVLLRLLNEL